MLGRGGSEDERCLCRDTKEEPGRGCRDLNTPHVGLGLRTHRPEPVNYGSSYAALQPPRRRHAQAGVDSSSCPLFTPVMSCDTKHLAPVQLERAEP